MHAIILAGGEGTRLRSVVQGVPKPMADINGKPFLRYLLNRLCLSGISRIVLATGYKHEVISNFFGSSYGDCELKYSIEKQPLGTGGAIRRALELTDCEQILVLNGDTLFDIDIQQLFQQHCKSGADLTLALKPMINFDRYGTVLEKNGIIRGFAEKKYCQSGLINAGVYLLRKSLLMSMPAETSFSFETDFLEKKVNELRFHAYITDKYFIDIGIPEDYLRACNDFERMFN